MSSVEVVAVLHLDEQVSCFVRVLDTVSHSDWHVHRNPRLHG